MSKCEKLHEKELNLLGCSYEISVSDSENCNRKK